jgi:hypothetical protein
MFLAAVAVDIYHRIAGSFYRRDTIPPGMSQTLVEIALIFSQCQLARKSVHLLAPKTVHPI